MEAVLSENFLNFSKKYIELNSLYNAFFFNEVALMRCSGIHSEL